MLAIRLSRCAEASVGGLLKSENAKPKKLEKVGFDPLKKC